MRGFRFSIFDCQLSQSAIDDSQSSFSNFGKSWVAHASRVPGFGVAPKRTFPLATSYRSALFVSKGVVEKVREPETASPTRETRALPRNPQSAVRSPQLAI
jgi:hypothetical protein